MLVLGLMSGTSADGVDAALVELRGAPPRLRWRLLHLTSMPYPADLRAELFACFRPETGAVDRLCALNVALGRAFADAAQACIRAAGLRPSDVDLIGSHGQTLWHIPAGARASTLQLGEAAVIAEATGIPVISNFRARDMAAGGQGAPLVACVDTLLFSDAALTRTALNIGGIANFTYLPARGASDTSAPGMRDAVEPFAFDTGPGNMLIDDAVRRLTDGAQSYDRDGAIAARGQAHDGLLAELMAHPYLAQRPPKTTGREVFGAQFGAQVWARGRAFGLSGEDIVATLTLFTATSIAQAHRAFLPCLPDEVIVSGGGARNATLVRFLSQALAPARVRLSDELGMPAEAKEAVAFAVLAYETWHGRPGNLPAATGARHAVVLGHITPGARNIMTRSEPAQQVTEAVNPNSREIDRLSALDIVDVINKEDRRVAEAVATQREALARAIDAVAERMRRGGRLIYIGAGTSGRLGVLDASEMPPTYNAAPGQVIGLIAGGPAALTQAIEGAEDDAEQGRADIAAVEVSARDCVMGIAASGHTPYVLGALAEARARGALTLGLTCNADTPLHRAADIIIAPVVGPEVISGSTRMKAGTATKLALNTLSTGVMVRLGKTFGNLMVDLQATNNKLRARAQRIVAQACNVSLETAARLLAECDSEVKTAIVSHLAGLTPEQARARLRQADGIARKAIEQS